MIHVLIFEDNRGRQDALQFLLQHTEDMVCAGSYDNCTNVVEIIKNTMPDVVLMDIDMPGVNGIEGLNY